MANNLEAARILLKNGAEIFQPEQNPLKSPLHEAAKRGNTGMIELLCQYYKKKSELANEFSPLFACFENLVSNLESLETLLNCGFDPNITRGHERY